MKKSSEEPAAEPTEAPAITAAMMAFTPVSVQGWQDVMSECSRFVADRLRQDLETQKEMLRCKTPAELLQLQTKFYQTALKQYTEETMRLFGLMSEATGKTVEERKNGQSRGYDDVPL